MSLLLDPRKFPAWGSIVGQSKVKATLEEAAIAILNGGALPNWGFFDAPGMGKTALVSSWLCNIAERAEGAIRVIGLNCKGGLNITSPEFKDLMGLIAAALSGQGPPTILNLDEFGTREAKGSGQAFLQAILSKIGGDAVGGEIVSVYGEGEFAYNPHRFGVIVTTWAAGRIPADLMDRFKQTHDRKLEEYSPEELSAIIKLAIARQLRMEKLPADSVKIHPSAVMLLARAMRGNARQCDNPIAKKVAIRIKARNAPEYLLDKGEAKTLRQECGLLPWGVSLDEREVLRHLKKVGADTASGITAVSGLKGEHWAKANIFLRYGHKEPNPFQIMKGDDPIPGKCGALITAHGCRWHITEHGKTVLGMIDKE